VVALCALIEPFYPKLGNGRPPVGVERMLHIRYRAERRLGMAFHTGVGGTGAAVILGMVGRVARVAISSGTG
jgi:hypothetical protein